MKSIRVFFFFAAVLPSILFSQEETLLGSLDIEHGGYGGPFVKFTSINDHFAVLVGGRGGWIINHTFVLGLGGYGLANNIPSFVVGPLGQRFVDFGYGGLDVEYVFDPDRLVHLSLHTLIGGGAVRYRHELGNDVTGPSDVLFVAEPGVNLDLNVITWFRFSVGAAYRYVSGVTSGVSTNKDLSGLSAQLTFRFGKF